MRYRAWDRENKIMSNGFNFDWLILGHYDLEFEDDGTLPLNDFKFFYNDYIVMRYSGLDGYDYDDQSNRFSNETKIYEGDILEINGIKKPVYFSRGAFMWNGHFLCKFDELPVPCGNIHKNPELVKI